MKRKNGFLLGMLAMVLVLGMVMSSCAAYMRWVRSVDPDYDSRETITVFPGGGGSSGGSSGSSGGSGSSSGNSGSSGGSSSSGAQQPANTTITRTYTFNVPTSGQAGGGASATAKAEAEANATERFRRENPGYEIRNVQSQHDGLSTLTVTITGRKI